MRVAQTYMGMFLALLLTIGVKSLWAGDTIYVKYDATGNNNGSSWEDAFVDLQDGLAAAGFGDQIWVARGVYYPTNDSTNRDTSFELKNGVALYGGFAGYESSLDERDWETNITVLSGDIDHNDHTDTNGVVIDPDSIVGNNSFHLVKADYVDSTTILDGFIITAGQANESRYPDYNGGGMYNESSSLTLTNCTFNGNTAYNYGGGMYNYESNPILNNCAFYSNMAEYYSGGGIYNYESNPTLNNCTFNRNSAFFPGGGGICNKYSSPILNNCTFYSNITEYGVGGGIYSYESSPTLTNCTFSGNTAYCGGGMYNNYESSPTLTNCIMWGDSAPYRPEIYNENGPPTISYSDIQGCGGSENWDPSFGVDSGYNIDADPLFVDMGNGDLHLQSGSPAIDAGNNDALPPGDTTDLDGNPRIVDGDQDGDTIVDMGAYEYQPPTFVHEDGPISVASQFVLYPISPNPSHLTTTIRFSLPEKSKVTLKVYDVSGREVSTLIEGKLDTGIHQVEFDGRNLPSGVYFYRLVAGSFKETKKVVLRK